MRKLFLLGCLCWAIGGLELGCGGDDGDGGDGSGGAGGAGGGGGGSPPEIHPDEDEKPEDLEILAYVSVCQQSAKLIARMAFCDSRNVDPLHPPFGGSEALSEAYQEVLDKVHAQCAEGAPNFSRCGQLNLQAVQTCTERLDQARGCLGLLLAFQGCDTLCSEGLNADLIQEWKEINNL